jgi:E3 ubiquitin-protein ligase UBR4
VSSDEGIGTLAENLLEALREHPDVNKKIDAARRETRAEKKRMAMAMRQKALGTLGMTVKSPQWTRCHHGQTSASQQN